MVKVTNLGTHPTDITKTSLTLRWDALTASTVTNYRILIYDEDGKWVPVTAVTGLTLTLTPPTSPAVEWRAVIGGLDPGTTYRFQVVGLNAAGDVITFPGLAIRTTAAATPLVINTTTFECEQSQATCPIRWAKQRKDYHLGFANVHRRQRPPHFGKVEVAL